MERLDEQKRGQHGVLSMIDAVLFTIIIFLVTTMIFQQFGGALTRERDLESSEFRQEAVHDIQKIALDSVIEEASYVNQSKNQRRFVSSVNITVERAIKDYLYLDHIRREEENLSYDLSGLESDIKQKYERCAWDVSRYRFSLKSSYRSSELFLSNVREINGEEDLPLDRAASTTTIILEQQRVDLTLYIWR